MKKEKKGTILKKSLVTILCAVALFMITASIIVKRTFYESSFLLNQIEKTKYSELVIKETSKNFNEDINLNNKWSKVVAASITPSFIDHALDTFIQHTYDKTHEDEQSSVNDIDEEITHAINSYAKKHQLTISKEDENKIKSMKFEFIYQLQRNIGDQYLVILIQNILSAKTMVTPFLYIGIILFVFLFLYLVILVKKPGYLLLRYGAIILGLSGSTSFLLAGLLYMKDFLSKIAFHSQATLQLMMNYTKSILLYFMFAGTLLLIGAVILGMISELFRRRNEKKREEKEELQTSQ